MVDLDGASSGAVCHMDIIADIVRKVRVPVQVGGGIRDISALGILLALGVKRVILGTAAVEDPTFVSEAFSKFAEGVIISVDARDGYASTRGWKTPTRVKATELAQKMVKAGARRIIYTDIASDGTMNEPNFAGIGSMMSRIAVPLIAAGGISKLEHLTRLQKMGLEGAIVGRALYDGGIDLKTALEELHAR